jgi:acyl-CoA thioesterase
MTTASARLIQDGKLVCIALGAFGVSRPGMSFVDRTPPRLPPPEDCMRLKERHPIAVELQNRYDSRIGLGSDFYSGADRAVIGGYIRLHEPRIVDALTVAAFTDAFPPPIFARASGQNAIGPVPTIDLTIHFRTETPLPGASPTDYCALVFTTTVSKDGYLEEDGEVWSQDGVLLAQSRQLALIT